MQGWSLRVTKRSLNLIRELRNYTWAKDRDGKLTDQPIDTWNHLLDAARYALFSEIAGNEGSGQYTIGFRNKPVPRNPVQRKQFVTESTIVNAYKQRNHR